MTSVAFSPDHSLLAFANDQEITVLDVISRAQVSILRELPENINGADSGAYRSGVGDTMEFIDSTRIVTTGMGGLVTVWDVRSGTRLARVESLLHGEYASTIEYSELANQLVIGTSQGQILLTRLNGNDPEPLVSVAHLNGYVQDIQFDPDGRYFASALMVPAAKPANGWKVSIWDSEQLKKVSDLEGADGVSKLALVPGEGALLTVGEQVRVWEFLTLEQAGLVRDPSMAVQYVGAGTLVPIMVLGLLAGGPTVHVPNLVLLPFALIPADVCIRTAAISPDGKSIVTTTKGPTHNVMSVIDRASNEVLEKWTADYFICDMQFSSDGKLLLSATSGGVWIYETVGWKKERLGEVN